MLKMWGRRENRKILKQKDFKTNKISNRKCDIIGNIIFNLYAVIIITLQVTKVYMLTRMMTQLIVLLNENDDTVNGAIERDTDNKRSYTKY